MALLQRRPPLLRRHQKVIYVFISRSACIYGHSFCPFRQKSPGASAGAFLCVPVGTCFSNLLLAGNNLSKALMMTVREDSNFSWAFRNCSHLTEVKVKPVSPPSSGNYAFNNCHSSLQLFVPASSLEDYKSKDGNSCS